MKHYWLPHELEACWSLTADEEALLAGRTELNRLACAASLKFFQIPPDLVVKSQAVDIIGLILPLIRGQNVIETSRRHMKIEV